MSRATSGKESLVQAADRHRRLQNALIGCDQVEHVDTLCHGANAPSETPAFESRLTLADEVKTVGPVVLEAIAAERLGIEMVQPQGPPGQRQLVVTVSR